jgi:TRAP transporter TAXI family solute receptor
MLSRRGLILAAAAGLVARGAAGAPADIERFVPKRPAGEVRLQIATDDSNSAYYAVGVGLSALAKLRLPEELGVDLYARTSLGSWDNAGLLRRGKVDLAIMQALYGHWARHGKGVFRRVGPDPRLRAIASLWPDAEHVIVRTRHASTGTIEDLRNLEGAPFVVGPRGSGIEGSIHLLMRRLGIDPNRALKPVNLGPTEAASALMMGGVVGLTLPGGPPISLVDAILSHDVSGVKVLEFTDRQLRLIDQDEGLWRRYVIPPGTYLGQEQPISTIAQPSFLAVRAETDPRVVQALTRIIFEDLTILRTAHKTAAAVSLNTALAGLPVPLHPGAVRYFQEAGLKIPASLLPA